VLKGLSFADLHRDVIDATILISVIIAAVSWLRHKLRGNTVSLLRVSLSAISKTSGLTPASKSDLSNELI
jgi:hypothetical protein